jgi:hypothetical protein
MSRSQAASPGRQDALIPIFFAHTPNVEPGVTVYVLCFVQSHNRHQVAFLCLKYLGYVLEDSPARKVPRYLP